MFADLLNSSYFALFLIVALGFMLGRIKIKGLSLDVSAVIFIALLFGHFGVIIPKELGNFGLVLFIFTSQCRGTDSRCPDQYAGTRRCH